MHVKSESQTFFAVHSKGLIVGARFLFLRLLLFWIKAYNGINYIIKGRCGMIRFNCDYSEGAHPKVLDKLIKTNMEQTEGYGEDRYCAQAACLIRERCGLEYADVHFLTSPSRRNIGGYGTHQHT